MKVKCFRMPLPTVYKYCSVDSMLKILMNKSLFLSHAQYVTDSAEIKNIRVILKKIMPKHQSTSNYFLIKRVEQIIRHYKGEVFLGCFSECRDRLSQWRGYADGGKGVAIGFDLNKIVKDFPSNLHHGSVIYDDGRKSSEIMSILDDYLLLDCDEMILLPYNKSRIDESNKQKNERVNNLMSFHNGLFNVKLSDVLRQKKSENTEVMRFYKHIHQLLGKSHFMKCQSFQEEAEYRICYTPTEFPDDKNHNLISTLQFRNEKQKIVPYHYLNFSNYKDMVKEVVLGPGCELDRPVIQSMLKTYGYKGVTISASASSYQP